MRYLPRNISVFLASKIIDAVIISRFDFRSFVKSATRFHFSLMASNKLEDCKKLAALEALKHCEIKNNTAIGIGSGSTIVHFIKCVSAVVKQNELNVNFVASSDATKKLLREHDLRVCEFNDIPGELDWTIDGADEVDKNENVMIKGGGACLTREKILAARSKKLYIIADYTKESEHLGTKWSNGLPIEVIPMCWKHVKSVIEQHYGGEVVLRMKGSDPLITDNHNYIIDWKFNSDRRCWLTTHNVIKLLPGVVETGIFYKMADAVYFAKENGTVHRLTFEKRII